MQTQPWKQFSEDFAGMWKQGEHVFIYGENGSGKTDINFRLLNMRQFSVALLTKPHDPIFTSPLTRGYKRVNSWPPREVNAFGNSHFLLSAKPTRNMDELIARQREILPPAIDNIYQDGGWTVSFDETLQLTRNLGMTKQLESFAYLARSNALSGVYCTQRPVRIPVIIPQSCMHAFIARSRRKDDLAVLAELGPDKNELARMMTQLHTRHDFIYVNTLGDYPLTIVNTHH